MSEVHEGTIDAAALKAYVDRAAHVMEEQKQLAEDLSEICTEADDAGVASKREIRKLARESLIEQDVLHSQLERMDALRQALGSFGSTPLGEAAVRSFSEGGERVDTATKPRPFAEQAVHRPRRGRKLVLFDREHPSGAA